MDVKLKLTNELLGRLSTLLYNSLTQCGDEAGTFQFIFDFKYGYFDSQVHILGRGVATQTTPPLNLQRACSYPPRPKSGIDKRYLSMGAEQNAPGPLDTPTTNQRNEKCEASAADILVVYENYASLYVKYLIVSYQTRPILDTRL